MIFRETKWWFKIRVLCFSKSTSLNKWNFFTVPNNRPAICTTQWISQQKVLSTYYELSYLLLFFFFWAALIKGLTEIQSQCSTLVLSGFALIAGSARKKEEEKKNKRVFQITANAHPWQRTQSRTRSHAHTSQKRRGRISRQVITRFTISTLGQIIEISGLNVYYTRVVDPPLKNISLFLSLFKFHTRDYYTVQDTHGDTLCHRPKEEKDG